MPSLPSGEEIGWIMPGPSSRIHIDQAIQNQQNYYFSGSESDIDLLKIVIQRSSPPRYQNIVLKLLTAAMDLSCGNCTGAERILGISRHTIQRYLDGKRKPASRHKNPVLRIDDGRRQITTGEMRDAFKVDEGKGSG